MDILVRTKKEPKWLMPDTFPYLKIYQNAFVASAPPQTSL